MTTKIHALTDAKGRPLKLTLTPGQSHDSLGAAELLQDLDGAAFVLGDKAYDADWIRDLLEVQGVAPNIPDKCTRKRRHAFSATLYRERNHVERFFNKIKHFRRIATRFEKHTENYLAMIKLAAVRLWLRSNESMA